MKPEKVLKQYYGYDSFRPGQKEMIQAILSGRDALGIMPTGAGKSICFQIPALIMDGVTLIVSPLISLMKDQVSALVAAGIPAAYLNSSLTAGQYRKALQFAGEGRYKLIYVAPERLLTEGFLDLCSRIHIAMVTVDEAHCISQWGQDFRPSYLQIPEFIEKLPYRPVVSAFTATATDQVRSDILKSLKLQDPHTLLTGFDRPNLYFSVQKPRDKMGFIVHYLDQHPEESGIIYCATRKNVEKVCEALQQQDYRASRYHAGLPEEERFKNQEDFLYDRKTVMVATNAFGMGIDKSNVSFVIHYNMPQNLESYYQEAGRAGRDGSTAECILLYSAQDVKLNEYILDQGHKNGDVSDQLLENEKELLKRMTFYSNSRICLRKNILRYFGEKRYIEDCGNCSVCKRDIYEEYVPQQHSPAGIPTIRKAFTERPLPVDATLYQRLYQVRRKVAGTYGIPPFTVFSDATLRDMAAKMPLNRMELMQVSGVGAVKSTKYGDAFLIEIREYLKSR